MRAWSSSYATMMHSGAPTIAICWMVTKANGGVVRGTQHDKDITIVGGPYAGTYQCHAGMSGSDVKTKVDLSVDNMSVEGAFPDPTDVITVDITHDDIIDDQFAFAPFVTFNVDWTNPSDYQDVVNWGNLGEITEESTGRYSAEARGPTQVFAENIVRRQGDHCDVKRLGRGFCQFAVVANTVTGTITAVTDRKNFVLSNIGAPVWKYARGFITFTSGANATYSREVKTDPRDNGGVIQLFEELPEDPVIGDAYSLEPGCNRSFSNCLTFGQQENFQGYGVFCPGIDAYIQGPI